MSSTRPPIWASSPSKCSYFMCDNSITYWTQRESTHAQQCSHLDFSRGGQPRALDAQVVCRHKSVLFKSEPHFIWNWCRSLIQNHTGGFSDASPLTSTKDSKRRISESIQKHIFIFTLTIFSMLYIYLNSYFLPSSLSWTAFSILFLY